MLVAMDDDLELLGSGVDPIAEQFETYVICEDHWREQSNFQFRFW